MLRWRLFGISFCIQPSFWLMNALWAYIMAGPISGRPMEGRFILVFIAAWILCTLVSVMVHELGHVITGRIFGQPGSITLTGMGGQAVGGYDELKPWKRILVILMGPCSGFAFAALIILLDGTAWNHFMDYLVEVSGKMSFVDWKVRTFWIDHLGMVEWRRGGNFAYITAISLLTFINIFINVMNLFPIIPMDGGMIFKEICVLIFPRQGLKIAFGFSFVVAVALCLFFLDVTLERWKVLPEMIEKYYPFGFPEFSLFVFGSMAYQCFQAYRQILARERYQGYMEDDGDERSGPGRLPAGVEEVPVKDPDDFAPRAPGSERPRR